MIKFLIGLITAITSFIGLIGNTNSALATPIVEPIESLVSNSLEQPVNLNLSSSLWQLGDRDSKDIYPHLGCSCAACSQVEVNNLL
jgi:hypothetical protein